MIAVSLSPDTPFISTFDDVDLSELSETFGTPLYVYSQSKIEEQVQALSRTLGGVNGLICFAVKANSNLSILRLFKNLGCGFDVVSGGELKKLLAIEASPDKVVFSGVGKSADELKLAIENGVGVINVESIAELEVLVALADSLNLNANVGFRLNPDIGVGLHRHHVTGTKEDKFGMPASDLDLAWKILSKSKFAKLIGVSTHVGSGGHDLAPFTEAYSALLEVARIFEERGAKIAKIDLGGGFGIGYSGAYQPLDLLGLQSLIESLAPGRGYQYIVEPGKLLIAEAGILLTRVLYRKESAGKVFIVTDAGMNDLVRPAMYDAFHKIELVSTAAKRAKIMEQVDIVGPVCESGCFFAQGREMPQLKAGDLLAIRDAGAYGFSMASNYNTRALPAEVLLCRGNSTLVRKREALEDLWRNEL